MPLLPDNLEYMLSSSPPGFELNLDIRHDIHVNTISSHRQQTFGWKPSWQTVETISVNESAVGLKPVQSEQNLERIRKWQEHYDDDVCTGDECDKQLDLPAAAPGIGRRSVSFADHLESVFVMEEASNEPPSHLLERLSINDTSDSAVDSPVLAVNFTQPASDYMAFRNKLMANFVSLENVMVKKYRVSGTVRVRNLSFNKTVVIRYTLNSWLTYDEVVAVYQPSGIVDNRFDTFSFSIDCPSDLAVGSKLIFAVRYVLDTGAEFWDSNNGENYQVLYVSSSSDGHTPIFSLQPPDNSWTEYSSWSSVDPDSPYW